MMGAILITSEPLQLKIQTNIDGFIKFTRVQKQNKNQSMVLFCLSYSFVPFKILLIRNKNFRSNVEIRLCNCL